ncbi:SEC61-beta family protein [Hyperthermus butylicus]|uniref:Preprotein translocase subunit Sec61beta n=1 Tax=Hyperthermus butylicus (strain DSM 5456 / JCM 9403 / PLM1-5) TaxID=415426 RepID=A2BIT0_HYPBU|nr:SEC61-beta family protein [Hyperthermus butylicus]ABM79886.1 hypothetical protein Hbut_0007 [Hyperthermus butylicus DSM 5456]
MARARRRSRSDNEKEKTKDTSPAVFSAAGLLAFSEEDAVVRLKPLHIMLITLGFIASVIVFNIV